jgi:putative SOS response-associated peptidase YedK
LKDQAPKCVTNVRDDKLDSHAWNASFLERRSLVRVTRFAEPKGRRLAVRQWFVLHDDREPFTSARI